MHVCKISTSRAESIGLLMGIGVRFFLLPLESIRKKKKEEAPMAN